MRILFSYVPRRASTLRKAVAATLGQADPDDVALLGAVIRYVTRHGLPDPVRQTAVLTMWMMAAVARPVLAITVWRDRSWTVQFGERALDSSQFGWPHRALAAQLTDLLIDAACEKPAEARAI